MIHLPNQIKQALDRIQEYGYEAYVVGGCVRDALIGKETHDYDITTNAKPLAIVELFHQYTVVETGIKHGTVTVVIQGLPIEITTYRVDGPYSDHRRPDGIDFTHKLKDDLKRRDFTINAMAYNEIGGIIDYFDGKKDIEDKVIRCVGNPDERFREDALRMIRAMRFSSVLGFSIEERATQSIHKNRELLYRISMERITSEFSKMICGDNIERILEEFSDIITVAIPEFGKLNQNRDAFFHVIKTVAYTPAVLHLRLASLIYHIEKSRLFTGSMIGAQKEPAEQTEIILERMRYDKRTIQRIVILILHWEMELIIDEVYIKRKMSQLTPEVFKEILLLKKAHELSQHAKETQSILAMERMNEMIDQILLKGGCFRIKDLAIKGDEILKLGVPSGKLVGEILAHLLDEVIKGSVKNEKSALESLVREYLRGNPL